MIKSFLASLAQEAQREVHGCWFWMLPEKSAVPEFSLSVVANGQLRLEHIFRYVAGYYGISYTDLISDRRTGKLLKPRFVAMYLARTITTKSLPEIGRAANNRNHTTILNAIRRAEEMMASDVTFSEEVWELEDALRAKVAA